MVTGLGIDLVEMARIAKAMRNPRFVLRVLTPKERLQPITVEYVAGRWAAKEAVAKAWSESLKWHDVEILSEPNGQPTAYIRGKNEGILISITHERTMPPLSRLFNNCA
ncbi:MAG: holo-ACP synthase [Fimbriimonadaceae bacterium]